MRHEIQKGKVCTKKNEMLRQNILGPIPKNK